MSRAVPRVLQKNPGFVLGPCRQIRSASATEGDALTRRSRATVPLRPAHSAVSRSSFEGARFGGGAQSGSACRRHRAGHGFEDNGMAPGKRVHIGRVASSDHGHERNAAAADFLNHKGVALTKTGV
jgi:hypothetical protein